MIRNLNFNHYTIILDNLYEDKEIFKNRALLTEKLQQIILICFLFSTTLLSYFIIRIQTQTIIAQNAAMIFIVVIIIIILLYKATSLLTSLKKNGSRPVLNDLFTLQVIVIILHIFMNMQVQQEVLFSDLTQIQITIQAVCNIFLTTILVSYQIKQIVNGITLSWLIIYSLKLAELERQEQFQLVSIYGQVVLNIIQNYIHQTVTIRSWQEYSERLEISFQTIHDIRNQVQAYIEMNRDLSDIISYKLNETSELHQPDGPDVKQIQPNQKDTRNQNESNKDNIDKVIENSKIKSKNAYSSLNQSYENISTIRLKVNKKTSLLKGGEATLKKPNSDSSLKVDCKKDSNKINNNQKIEKSKQITNENTNDEEEQDYESHEKFILQKVCFLQHLELIFENMYNINNGLVDIKSTMINIGQTLKILFMNKNNSIKLELKTQVTQFKLDSTVLEQLIVELCRLFHELHYDNITIQILAHNKDYHMELALWVRVPELHLSTIQVIESKHIIRRLIVSLNSDVDYITIQTSNFAKYLIKLPLNDKIKKISQHSQDEVHSKKSSKESKIFKKSSRKMSHYSNDPSIGGFSTDKQLIQNETLIIKIKKESVMKKQSDPEYKNPIKQSDEQKQNNDIIVTTDDQIDKNNKFDEDYIMEYDQSDDQIDSEFKFKPENHQTENKDNNKYQSHSDLNNDSENENKYESQNDIQTESIDNFKVKTKSLMKISSKTSNKFDIKSYIHQTQKSDKKIGNKNYQKSDFNKIGSINQNKKFTFRDEIDEPDEKRKIAIFESKNNDDTSDIKTEGKIDRKVISEKIIESTSLKEFEYMQNPNELDIVDLNSNQMEDIKIESNDILPINNVAKKTSINDSIELSFPINIDKEEIISVMKSHDIKKSSIRQTTSISSFNDNQFNQKKHSNAGRKASNNKKRSGNLRSSQKMSMCDYSEAINRILDVMVEVPFERSENLIQINVDDEENIIRMNRRVCAKEKALLNGCRNIEEFLNLLKNIQVSTKAEVTKPSILCIMDHMLDKEFGQEGIQQAKALNNYLNMDLTFILLSSTEDKDTLSKYHREGVKTTICKPLNKKKIKPVIEHFESVNLNKSMTIIVDL